MNKRKEKNVMNSIYFEQDPYVENLENDFNIELPIDKVITKQDDIDGLIKFLNNLKTNLI